MSAVAPRPDMSERAGLSPHDAAEVLRDASRWDQTIRQRTEGITWMVWGLVTAGTLMTLGFVTTNGVTTLGVLVAWPPWLFLGFLLTHAVWRMAAIGRPSDLRPPRAVAYLAKTVAVALFVLGLHYLLRPETLAGPMALIGAAWAAVGLFARNVTREGRRTLVAIGVAVLVAATLLEVSGPPMVTLMLLGTAVLALVPVAFGSHQALRG